MSGIYGEHKKIIGVHLRIIQRPFLVAPKFNKVAHKTLQVSQQGKCYTLSSKRSRVQDQGFVYPEREDTPKNGFCVPRTIQIVVKQS